MIVLQVCISWMVDIWSNWNSGERTQMTKEQHPNGHCSRRAITLLEVTKHTKQFIRGLLCTPICSQRCAYDSVIVYCSVYIYIKYNFARWHIPLHMQLCNVESYNIVYTVSIYDVHWCTIFMHILYHNCPNNVNIFLTYTIWLPTKVVTRPTTGHSVPFAKSQRPVAKVEGRIQIAIAIAQMQTLVIFHVTWEEGEFQGKSMMFVQTDLLPAHKLG